MAAARLLDATLDLLWRQWRAIGGAAAGRGAITKQVDPEALCLASLYLQEAEPRLWTVMVDWLRLGSALLSVQRLKNLAKQFPPVEDRLRALAAAAVEEAKDARWRSLLGPRPARKAAPRKPMKLRGGGPALTAPPALVLRLRAAFQVGVKADLLAFLLGQPLRVSVSTAAQSLGYSVPPVFRALQDLVAAQLVQSGDFPSGAEYWVHIERWHEVLGGWQAIARWGFWREVLVYVCAALALEQRGQYRKGSDYARAAALRELALRHEGGLVRSGLVEHGVPRSPSLEEWGAFHAELARRLAELA